MRASTTACLLTLLCSAGHAETPFAIQLKEGLNVELAGRPIAQIGTPKGMQGLRLTRETNGITRLCPEGRQEAALFKERLEYTYEFQLSPPVEPWTVLLLPLAPGDTAAIVHGSFERPPKTTEVTGSDLLKAAGSEIGRVRYITVNGEALCFSLDTQPAGAMGEDPADMTSGMRAVTCQPKREGLEIRAALTGSRAAHPACMRAKFIFYADGRSFRDVHPFIIMNYRYAFEKVVKLDFTRAPMPKKSYLPRSVQTAAHDAAVGYGWLGDRDAIEIRETSLRAPLYGDLVTSRKTGCFRIDVPPGHYYLTLSFGNADVPVGPMRVSVNGEEHLARFALDRGRYRAEVLWITSTQDLLDISLEGLNTAPWQINAIAVSSLGTLNEDFTLTRPGWHVKH